MSSPHNPLDQLAQEFLTDWRAAHGFGAGSASTLTGPDHLAILIEGAFSQAERKLAEDQNGEALLRQYAFELLNQICEQKLALIRDAVGREVCGSDINVNPDTDQVIFIFKFESTEETQRHGAH